MTSQNTSRNQGGKTGKRTAANAKTDVKKSPTSATSTPSKTPSASDAPESSHDSATSDLLMAVAQAQQAKKAVENALEASMHAMGLATSKDVDDVALKLSRLARRIRHLADRVDANFPDSTNASPLKNRRTPLKKPNRSCGTNKVGRKSPKTVKK